MLVYGAFLEQRVAVLPDMPLAGRDEGAKWAVPAASGTADVPAAILSAISGLGELRPHVAPPTENDQNELSDAPHVG